MMPSGLTSTSSGDKGSIKIADASALNDVVDSPAKDLDQSTCIAVPSAATASESGDGKGSCRPVLGSCGGESLVIELVGGRDGDGDDDVADGIEDVLLDAVLCGTACWRLIAL
jgi:hypothetical protein